MLLFFSLSISIHEILTPKAMNPKAELCFLMALKEQFFFLLPVDPSLKQMALSSFFVLLFSKISKVKI